eukprot:scaffold13396_cov95-Isochrysis_galbana.AAC.1
MGRRGAGRRGLCRGAGCGRRPRLCSTERGAAAAVPLPLHRSLRLPRARLPMPVGGAGGLAPSPPPRRPRWARHPSSSSRSMSGATV